MNILSTAVFLGHIGKYDEKQKDSVLRELRELRNKTIDAQVVKAIDGYLDFYISNGTVGVENIRESSEVLMRFLNMSVAFEPLL